MRYELKKILGDYKLIVVIIVAMLVSASSIIGILDSGIEYYYETYNYSQEDYTALLDKANENLQNNQDVIQMKKIISLYSNREWNYKAYDSREKDYVEYNKSGLISLLIIIIFAVKLIEAERDKGMCKLVCTVSDRNKKVFRNKQITLITICVAVQSIFFLEDLLLFCIFGGVYPSLKLYTVPGYIFTWFNGNIFMYKLLDLISRIVVSIIFAELAYLICTFIRGEIKNFCISVFIALGCYNISLNMPHLRLYLNPASLLNISQYMNEFSYISIGGVGFNFYQIAIVIGILIMAVFVVLFSIISQKRGVL